MTSSSDQDPGDRISLSSVLWPMTVDKLLGATSFIIPTFCLAYILTISQSEILSGILNPFILTVGVASVGVGLVSWSFPAKRDWRTEIVLITGGGSGIGALLALKLARSTDRAGVKVVVLTNQPPTYAKDTDGIYTYQCDVSNKTDLTDVAERVRFEIGDPTIIVNNAGVVKGKLLLDLTEEDVVSTFQVNAIAPFWVLQAFLPAMLLKRRGHVVNVASVLGLVGVAQMTDYCASKAAIVSLNASLRQELDIRYNTPEIKTTLVLPGHILTDMFRQTHMPTSYLFKFLSPSLTPDAVVMAILRALDSQKSQSIRLPFGTHLARIMGPGPALLPTFLCRWIQHFTDADWAMRDYGPRPDTGERLAMKRQQQGLF